MTSEERDLRHHWEPTSEAVGQQQPENTGADTSVESSQAAADRSETAEPSTQQESLADEHNKMGDTYVSSSTGTSSLHLPASMKLTGEDNWPLFKDAIENLLENCEITLPVILPTINRKYDALKPSTELLFHQD